MSKDTSSDFILFIGIGLIILMIVMLSVAVTQAVNTPHDYARGYCAALGGDVLNNESCDVDGKVVAVVRD